LRPNASASRQLGYDDPAVVDSAKIGIFVGSALSGVAGRRY
jgi:hypothetical protein